MGRKKKEPAPSAPRPSDRVIRFCRKYMKHTKGRWRGEPFLPEPWQIERIIRPLYDTLNPDGTRQYRTVYCEMGRKNGKSFLGGMLALFQLLFDNEPGAEVISAAGKKDQARLIFNNVADIVKADPVLSSLCKVKRDVIETRDGGTYSVVSADAFTNHGGNISTLIFDEFWVQKSPLLYEALTTGMGARSQPITFLCTTSGFDKTSICFEKHVYAKKVLSGVVKDREFLPILFGADETDDWTDKKVWKKANPNLGVTVSMDYLESKFIEAQENPSREIAFRQLFLSQWVTSESRWFSSQKLEDSFVEDADWPDLSGQDCWLGMDLSSTSDLTSVSACWFHDGLFWIDCWSWAPRGSLRTRRRANRAVYDQWAPRHITITEGDVIDYGQIKKHIDSLCQRFRVVDCATDRWNATALANALQADGLTMVGFGQGYAAFSPAAKDFEALILSGKVRIRTNPVFRWAFGNVMITRDHADNIKPDKAKSGDKIDPIISAIMALARGRLAESHGQSSYEGDGLLVV